MKPTFDGLAKSPVRRLRQKRIGTGLVATALACLALAYGAQAQTTVVCDPAGDTVFSSGKSGPAVPPWLDIVQAEVSAGAGGSIIFTLTMNAPVPEAPAWNGVDDGGQLWWGWRMVDDLATDYTVKNGCIKAQGGTIPAGYFLDLIWDVTSATFQARLLDDTTCAQTTVPLRFQPTGPSSRWWWRRASFPTPRSSLTPICFNSLRPSKCGRPMRPATGRFSPSIRPQTQSTVNWPWLPGRPPATPRSVPERQQPNRA